MKYSIRTSGVFLALLLWCSIASLSYAQVVNISATVLGSPAPTIIVFSGIAYPNAPITVLQDGGAFATATANAQARFSVSTSGVSTGAHTYTLSAQDAQGRTSKTYQVVLNIAANTTTTVSNIFFGPTIVISNTSIQEGDAVTLFGITSPNSTITIQFISDSTTSYTTTANANGVWSRVFSAELSEGNYTIRTRTTDPDTSVSEWSATVSLTVGAPPDVCLGKNIADINCDGEVDLVDLSILLSFWKQTNPSQTRSDINSDTKVDLIDFSIMMFYWTGPT